MRAAGGRVIAVGTTAVRAVGSAAGADGAARARAGWTDLVVAPERGVRVVGGLLTGLHEPEASHLLMLEAVAGRAVVGRGYEEALRGRYLPVARVRGRASCTAIGGPSHAALLQQLSVKPSSEGCEAAHRAHITYEED
ncbi:hypothetical protein GCM10010266_53920 [Streptomyces griseomycini]|nr:hypothetical protein GCM10010266_53920 [Streptomyces griseomycini]